LNKKYSIITINKHELLDGIQKNKTPIMHFFKSPSHFKTMPLGYNIVFICKFCDHKLQAQFKETSNLNKHLKSHAEFNNWLKLFNAHFNRTKETMISDKLFSLIKYFISSNAALAELKNEHFLKILDPSISCPSYNVFRNELLPSVMERFYSAVQNKLNRAVSVTLILDIWTNRLNRDFVALAASIIDHNFERELIVIGMMRMPPTGHNAESIKQVVECLINKYHFDKSKLRGNYQIFNS
jgi:hypothetical protein